VNVVERARAGLDWLDARSMRERAVILAGALALLLAVWQTVLMDPIAQLRASSAVDLPALSSELPALNAHLEQLEVALKNDPDAAAREHRDALRAERGELDARLTELTDGLIPPSEMSDALRELLRREPGVSLVKLEALPAEPLLIDDATQTGGASAPRDPNQPQPAVFKHSVVIELKGDYLSTLRYVESIEELKWRFFWDSLDYQVEEHPEAHVRLILYSLSLREGWLGV
jgi:MSHA biogenesis protein MshJ